jgi:hypothetical protein
MWTKPLEIPAICASLWLSCVVLGVSVCCAQSRPTEDCKFAYNGFAISSGQEVQIAEVRGRSTTQLEVCGSPKVVLRLPLFREHRFRSTNNSEPGLVAMFPDTTELDRPGFVLTHSLSSTTVAIHRSLRGQERGWAGRIMSPFV